MTKALTLPERDNTLTLPDKSIALTLRNRDYSLSLPDRVGGPSNNAATLAQFAILQGFRYGGAFNRRVFLLYGLVGDLYDNAPDKTLMLRRRRLALTLGG